MALSVRQGGAWQDVLDPSLRVGGAWAPIQAMWIMQGGSWELVYVRMTAPTGLSATDASWCEDLGEGITEEHYEIQLNWTNSDATKQTNIYRDGVLIDTASAGATGYLDSGLAQGTSYSYEVAHYEPGSSVEGPHSSSDDATTASNICGI